MSIFDLQAKTDELRHHYETYSNSLQQEMRLSASSVGNYDALEEAWFLTHGFYVLEIPQPSFLLDEILDETKEELISKKVETYES